MKQTNNRKNFERQHLFYQKRAYNKLIKDFRAILKGINFNDLSEANIDAQINDSVIEKTMYSLYLSIGLKYGKDVVNDLESEKKALKPFPLFSDRFQKFILKYFRDPKKGGAKIVSITSTLKDKVMRVISENQTEGLTQSQIAKNIQKAVNKPEFYRANAMRIARTESLFAMNTAKVESYRSTSFEMVKIWQHGGSRHPRNDHLEMDQKEVGIEDDFILPNGERGQYPGAAGLSAESVINCSCSVSYAPVRDEDGNLKYK